MTYEAELGQHYQDVHKRLQNGSGAKIVDLGVRCPSASQKHVISVPTRDLQAQINALTQRVDELSRHIEYLLNAKPVENVDNRTELHIDTSHITIHKIIDIVSQGENISIQHIIGPRRQKDITLARHIAYYLSVRFTNKSYPQIGVVFDRDHTSILSGSRRIDRQRKTIEGLGIKVATYERRILELAKLNRTP